MPEYLAPGVYVEEVSFRSKSIEALSTSTAGFIGPAHYGPTTLIPQLLTSIGEFERIYGGGQQLNFNDTKMDNYLWHAARAFFTEGGKRLYVQRVFRAIGNGDKGVGYVHLPSAGTAAADRMSVEARFPGALGNLRVRFTLHRGQNLLDYDDTNKVNIARSLQENDVVWIRDVSSPPIFTAFGGPISSPPVMPDGGQFYLAKLEPNPTTSKEEWIFRTKDGTAAFDLQDLDPESDLLQKITLTVAVISPDPLDIPQVWNNIPLDPAHMDVAKRAKDGLTGMFGVQLANRDLEYSVPIVITVGGAISNGLNVLELLRQAALTVRTTAAVPSPEDLVYTNLVTDRSTDVKRSFEILLDGGNDGVRPGAAEYEGEDDQDLSYKSGLKAFEDLDDISIVAAPGSTYGYEKTYSDDARQITNLLIGHAEKMRYRIAVLDSGDGQTLTQVRKQRAKLDSKYAALYYPWVRILDPMTRTEKCMPPSGFVAGIYARNDINRAVYKAPANEVVNLALGFETVLNKAQQDVLNPEGINCFRFFEGRGNRLWGARTITSDPEWKYVNLRRYFAYLEHSIDKGTQWAVFEPNGEMLWANVRRTIEDFLLNEWQSGALLGDKPEKAYFVRCDRSTMTQNDLDNGRMICLIGVAPLRPAEYVIFRIGQWTLDAKKS
jgi:phage tail sheath protein FI